MCIGWFLGSNIELPPAKKCFEGKIRTFFINYGSNSYDPHTTHLAGGSSLLEPKNQPMHTDATYGTYDKWNNYALEWYQVVLGCLRVHKNVFTKLICPKRTSRTVRKSPFCELVQMHPFSSITKQTAYVVWFWRLYDHEKEFRTPQNCSLKQCHGSTNLRQYFADLLETFGCKKLFYSTSCTFSMPMALI